MQKVHLEEVTLLQAVAECYNFHPRSHKKESNSKLHSKAKTKLYGLENHGQKLTMNGVTSMEKQIVRHSRNANNTFCRTYSVETCVRKK